MPKWTLAEESLGYVTSPDESNTDFRFLVGGSKNTIIDYQKKVKSRSGYTRLGAANTSLTAVRNAWTWKTSTGTTLPQRFYDDELEVYLGTVDGVAINAWKRVADGWSTTEIMRAATWWDTGENLDEQIMVIGNANTYEWNGAVATIASTTTTTITKNGSTTWAQNRFYTTGNKTVIINGTEYAYTGGETTTTLTGVTPDPTGEANNSLVSQKIVTNSNSPAASRTNHFVFSFENQIVIGSEDDEEVYISKNNDYTSFTFSSPRVSGEGALLTIDDATRGFASLGSLLVIFAGNSSIYQTRFDQLDVGGTLTETLTVKKLDTGVDQGALVQECIVPIGDAVAYLSNEVALRIIESPEDLVGINPRTFSNPIKPDFDAESWKTSAGVPRAYMTWYKNMLVITAPEQSRMYMLNFIEDADGKLFRFWNPPQVLPAGPLSVIDSGTGNYLSNGDKLHFHSNTIPETYLAFDGASDGNYDGIAPADKLPIAAEARFAYVHYGNRGNLKTFDEYYVEGEITSNTKDLLLTIKYDFAGATQTTEKTIDGSDEDILEGSVGINSLAQQSLAVNPLGGLLNPPEDARKFRVVFELAKEDFFEVQGIFSSNEVDRYWSIIAHGTNANLSPRKATSIRK